jgi:hypothetical protein
MRCRCRTRWLEDIARAGGRGFCVKPLGEIRRIIAEDSERGRDLHQSAAFAGMLSEPERRKLLTEIR